MITAEDIKRMAERGESYNVGVPNYLYNPCIAYCALSANRRQDESNIKLA